MSSSSSRRDFLKTVPAAAAAAGSISLTPSQADASQATAVPPSAISSTLWYREPAKEWTDALPVGNGRLGAMVFGGTALERLQLNEDTLWSGHPHDFTTPKAKQLLPELRRLIMQEEKYVEAEALAKQMQGPYNQSYQTLGYLRLEFAGILQSTVEEYRRDLNLDTAIAAVTYRSSGVTYTREVLASYPDQVIAIRLTASRPGSIRFRARFDCPLQSRHEAAGNDALALRGKAPAHVDPNYYRTENPIRFDAAEGKGMRFECRVQAVNTGGTVTASMDGLRVDGADAVTLLITAATGYRGFDNMPDVSEVTLAARCEEILRAAAKKSWGHLRSTHINDHQKLYRRVELDLGSQPDKAEMPTGERLRALSQSEDPGLLALYFQYGRYLLIASSRPGSQPANLQGIWNDRMRPPWSSNYTININTQMNYWPVEVCNLHELAEPLVRLTRELSVTGATLARVNYGVRGWVAHHNTDLWRDPPAVGDYGKGDPSWSMWPMGGAWLCTNVWEHYAFTRNFEFLRDQAYPVIKSATEFGLDWLIPDGQGHLVTCPSTSPENKFFTPDGQRASLSMGATMDMSILWDLFTHFLEASRVLGRDEQLRSQVESAREQLLPLQIGSEGQLLEWYKEFKEAEPGHRHMSHLFGLHPGHQITLRGTPEFAQAARRSLELRLQRGGGHTGWSRAWIINFWARLEDGEKAYENVLALLNKSTLPNLFDNHPPFQIDGNFGGTAGIAEMLLQSHAGEIHFLPAMPKAWASGRVSGLVARGAAEVSISWQDGRAVQANLRSRSGGTYRLRAPQAQTISAVRGARLEREDPSREELATVKLTRGMACEVLFK